MKSTSMSTWSSNYVKQHATPGIPTTPNPALNHNPTAPSRSKTHKQRANTRNNCVDTYITVFPPPPPPQPPQQHPAGVRFMRCRVMSCFGYIYHTCIWWPAYLGLVTCIYLLLPCAALRPFPVHHNGKKKKEEKKVVAPFFAIATPIPIPIPIPMPSTPNVLDVTRHAKQNKQKEFQNKKKIK